VQLRIYAYHDIAPMTRALRVEPYMFGGAVLCWGRSYPSRGLRPNTPAPGALPAGKPGCEQRPRSYSGGHEGVTRSRCWSSATWWRTRASSAPVTNRRIRRHGRAWAGSEPLSCGRCDTAGQSFGG